MAMRKRAKFNLSNFHNCTLKMGQLYPVHLQEVLPGDTVQMSTSVFLRFAPMVAPVMHPTHMFVHTFYIPSRVIANWMSQPVPDGGKEFQGRFDFESFITGGVDGMDSQTLPKCMILKSIAETSGLLDAFGIPVQNLSPDANFSINALPIAAYYMIWNEYYRDQDLQKPFFFYVQDGSWKVAKNDSSGCCEGYPLAQPCWSKDYFTTARPWPQKGPQVTIPVDLAAGTDPSLVFSGSLANSAITGVPTFTGSASPSAIGAVYEGDGILGTNDSNGDFHPFTGSSGMSLADGTVNGTVAYDPGTIGTGAVNISDLREAMALQRFEEHRSMFGSRYEDYLRYLGVRPQDARLQLPEYLGGFTSPVQFSEVLQTSAGENGGVGDLYGHGISAARGRRIRRFIPEHGYIMSLMCVRPIPVYSQGIERLWSKKTKEDFWQRELQHIGQQEILSSEIYANGITDEDDAVFGFQNRYDEYRRGVNIVTGEFRTNQDFWTLARIFDNRPALNSDFVECNPSDRIFQVGEQNSDQLYCMVKNNVIAKRLVDKNGNPM